MECCYKQIDGFSLLLNPLVEVRVLVYWVRLLDKMLGEALLHCCEVRAVVFVQPEAGKNILCLVSHCVDQHADLN